MREFFSGRTDSGGAQVLWIVGWESVRHSQYHSSGKTLVWDGKVHIL